MTLTDLKLFGSEAFPLRPSKLDRLAKCPMFAVLSMFEPEDEGGTAAQNGSLVHLGVAAFHKEPDASRKVQAGLAAIAAGLPTFPLADPNEVRLFYEPYSRDPRNINARFATDASGRIGIEYPVTLRLSAHDLDPTGAEIVIKGTLDQLRINPDTGAAEVWDLKTGRPDGWAMIHMYALQQAAYTLAARQSGFPTAVLGGLIRNHGYRSRGAVLPSPDGVFWSMPFSVAACEALMDSVRLTVAMIRRSEVNFGPGTECSYCQFGGLQGCIPKAEEKFRISLV